MYFPPRDIVERIKKEFPEGTKIVLDKMDEPGMKPGMCGVVYKVDDAGTIFARWENGSGLGVVYGEDLCHKE